MVSQGLVLVYRVLNGDVISVSQISLNGVGKLDDEWVDLPGFRLPSIRELAAIPKDGNADAVIERGLYSSGPAYERISALLNKSTARIRLDANTGIGWNGESIGKVEQLLQLMESVTDKDVLVISAGKASWKNESDYITKITKLAESMGFKKTVIVDDHSAGIFVRRAILHKW